MKKFFSVISLVVLASVASMAFAQAGIGAGLIGVGAGLAIGLCAIGVGIAQAGIGTQSLEIVTQLLPPSQALSNFPYDKAVHGLGFAVFALLLYLATRHLFFSLVIAIGYGTLLEYIQIFTLRTANWDDFIFNCLGALLVIGLIFILLRLRKWQRGPMVRQKATKKLSMDELALQLSWTLNDISERIDNLDVDANILAVTKLYHAQGQLAGIYIRLYHESETLQEINDLERSIQGNE